MAIHLVVVSSTWRHLLLPLHLPPVFLPFPLLPPQQRAAAGAQQEDHGKPVRLRQQRVWGYLRRPLPHHTKNSVIFSGGDSSKNYGADQQRVQMSDPHFDQFPTLQQHLLVGWWNSRLRYVLVHNYQRKLCHGSKKWSWLTQWMIWNLRVLSQELMVQTPSCSTRELLQHWAKSSRIPASRKGSVWRKWKLTKETVSFAVGRLLNWSTNTSGSLGPTILSRTMPT